MLPGPSRPLRDLEATAFAEQHVRGRHPDIVEQDFKMAVRRLIMADEREHSLDDDLPEDHRFPLMAVR